MRVIRSSVFETNSSSQHSIIKTKNDIHIDPEKLIWDRDKNPDPENLSMYNGRWELWGISEGYGRAPFKILTTFEDKFKYAMCEYLGDIYPDDPEWDKWYDEFSTIAYEIIPGLKEIRIRTEDVDIYNDENGNHIMHKNLRYDHWNEEEGRSEYYYFDDAGNKHAAIFDEDDYMERPDIGMIDHQSMGLLRNYLEHEGIDLKEFLTNKRYCIVITGDEYDDWPRMKFSGLIDMDFIIEEYGTHGEDLEYQEWLEGQKENEKSN